MSERITKVQRWLDLVAFLIGRRIPVPVSEIMQKVPAYAQRWETGDETDRATARRTFERDKEELREFGIVIEAVAYPIHYGLEMIEGYLLIRRDFYLPELKLGDPPEDGERSWVDRHRVAGVELREEDAHAALDALRRLTEMPASPFAREARTAFLKLAFDLDPNRFAPAPVLYAQPPDAAELLARLGTLSDALLARKKVAFRYHGIYRGEPTDREVAPYGIFFQHGHWYLVGYDFTRSGLRVFRVGRMENVVVNKRAPKTPDYEVPPDFRIQDYLDRQAWDLGDRETPLRAEVLFEFPASLWAERNRYGELVEERADGSAVRAFEIYQAEPFLRWLLSLAGEARLLGPSDLVDELHSLAAAVAEIYEEPVEAE